MNDSLIHLLLADDDKDDCDLFADALEELNERAILKTIHDGEQLLSFLSDKSEILPDLLFLDLNMPRKNGLNCLREIKNDERLKSLPVIIFSTSFDPEIVNQLYKNGAQYYIRKPNEFNKLKKVIHNALLLASNTISTPENFVLQA